MEYDISAVNGVDSYFSSAEVRVLGEKYIVN